MFSSSSRPTCPPSFKGERMPPTEKETAEYAFDLQVGLNGADVPEFDAARLLWDAAVAALRARLGPQISILIAL